MIFRRPLTLGEHAMVSIITALLTITFYAILLYSFEEKITCTPKHCAESSGPSKTPASTTQVPAIPRSPSSDGLIPESSPPSSAWTSEELMSTDQHAGSWIPPLAGTTGG